MKKLSMVVLLLVSGCAKVQTQDKCTPILSVESKFCYNVCLDYSRLSKTSPVEGINRVFFSCLDEVCGGGYVCLSNIEVKTTKNN